MSSSSRPILQRMADVADPLPPLQFDVYVPPSLPPSLPFTILPCSLPHTAMSGRTPLTRLMRQHQQLQSDKEARKVQQLQQLKEQQEKSGRDDPKQHEDRTTAARIKNPTCGADLVLRHEAEADRVGTSTVSGIVPQPMKEVNLPLAVQGGKVGPTKGLNTRCKPLRVCTGGAMVGEWRR